ncbi:MAG: hypothetical protein ACP5T4_02925, partial [Candidatus Micrarchaeia archaeon]
TRNNSTYIAGFVVAVKNATAFDQNPSLPAVNSTHLAFTFNSTVTYSTSDYNDTIIGVATTCHLEYPIWYGLTSLSNAGGEFADAYTVASSPLTNAKATVQMGEYTGLTVFAVH